MFTYTTVKKRMTSDLNVTSSGFTTTATPGHLDIGTNGDTSLIGITQIGAYIDVGSVYRGGIIMSGDIANLMAGVWDGVETQINPGEGCELTIQSRLYKEDNTLYYYARLTVYSVTTGKYDVLELGQMKGTLVSEVTGKVSKFEMPSGGSSNYPLYIITGNNDKKAFCIQNGQYRFISINNVTEFLPSNLTPVDLVSVAYKDTEVYDAASLIVEVEDAIVRILADIDEILSRSDARFTTL